MPIKLYDTREAVPEPLRNTAIETKDGKFAAAEEPEDLGEKGAKALQAEREARKLEKKRADEAEQRAADLEREREARAKGVSEEELQKIRDAEALARKPIVDERDTLAAENCKLKLHDKVKSLWLKYGGMGEREEDAMDALAKRTDLGDAGGIIVKNRDGTVSAESIDDFLSTTFKKEKAWLYHGTGASGSGATGSEGGGASHVDPKRIAAEKRELVKGAL